MTFRKTFLVLFLLLVSVPHPVFAWSNQISSPVAICEAPENQFQPQIVRTPNGYCLIFWVDERRGTVPGASWKFRDIYGQKLSSSGECLWQDNGLVLVRGWENVTFERQQGVKAASDGSGGAFFTWTDSSGGGIQCDNVRANRIDGEGNLLWGLGGVLVQEGDSGANESICQDGAGGIFSSWTYAGFRLWYNRLKAARLNTQGERVVDYGSISCMGGGDGEGSIADTSKVISTGVGEAVIAWLDARDGPYPGWRSLRVQRLAEAKVWDREGVRVSLPNNILNQVVATYDAAPDGAGGVICFWTDNRNGENTSDIFAQRVSSAGSVMWQDGGVGICTASGGQEQLQAVSDGQGGAIVVWRDGRSGYRIYAQRVDASGNVQWGDNGMLVSNTDSNTPRIINTSDGNFLVSWLVSNGIMVQKIDINGVGWWTVGGVQVFNQAVGNDYQMVEDGDGIIFVWSSGGNIYAQKLFNNGTLDASSPLAVSVNALTNGTFGQPYQYRIAATGGNGNRYQWQITSGRLPSGLDFDVATGIVSGTPQETGAFYFSVSVTDGATVIEKDLQMFIQIETGLETEWNDQPQVAKGSSYLVVTRKSNKLWGCFLNDNGEVIGSKFLIYSAGWIPRQPEVVYNPVNQKYLVVFSADSKLRGVFIDGATREVGQEFIIVDANYWFPAAAVNTQSGSYLVMACEYVYGGAWKGIILDKDGNTVVPLFQIGQYSEYGYSGAVAYNPDSDNFLAVYSYRQKNMKGRTVENDGSLGTEQTVATSPNSNGLDCPSLIYNSTTGKYLLGYSIINSYRVRANYLNGDGTVSSSAFYVSRTSLQEGDIIDVAVAKDGTEWAFWHDYADSQGQQTYGNSYIYAQKITAEGPAFESDLLITNYAGFKQKPAVVPGNANNNFLVFWNQDYSKVYGTFWKIPAQRGDLNEDGSLDIADLVICVRVVLGFDEPDLLLGDINRDGVVDIFDVILLLKEILNLN